MTTPIFAEKISKEEIAQMEVEEYKGRIITILTPEEAEKAVSYLMQFPALGIDTETRPCFQKGKSYIVSLLQVSTADTCFLFRLNHIGLPQSILSLYADHTHPAMLSGSVSHLSYCQTRFP